MTYHTRNDIPYHYALADAFTICDAYHCSLLGPTDPNRYHLWTGNDGNGGGPVITNAEAGYDWVSYLERLQQAGITWKIYQDIGDGLDADAGNCWGWTSDPYVGNYGNNALLYLQQYQNAQPGNPLADFAKTGTEIKKLNRDPIHLLDVFRKDVETGKLPQVSWIATPEAYTEHPGLIETNITPWRRAVTGDLTSMFNFDDPNSEHVKLPSTHNYLPPDLLKHDSYQPVVPTAQKLPTQEPGVRPARQLPYQLHANAKASSAKGILQINFGNSGHAAAVFQVRSADALVAPRSFTVEPEKKLSGEWLITNKYDLSVYGPNGFFRNFKGSLSGTKNASLDVVASYDTKKNSITLSITNLTSPTANIQIKDMYNSNNIVKKLDSGKSLFKSWQLNRSYGWYDLAITVESDPSFEYRFAGHLENGENSINDPSMAGGAYPRYELDAGKRD